MVETKSGGKTFHGSAWDYFRNDALDANNHFATVKTKLRQNIFGYTFGGPIAIPHVYNSNRDHKLFFFASNEWRRIMTGSTQCGLVSPAQRAGAFSNTTPLKLDALGIQQLAARGAVNCITGPNTINPSCIDPNSISLPNALYEWPNNTSSQNYINQEPQTLSQDSYNYRVDEYITPNEVLTGRFSYEQVKNGIPLNSFNGNIVAATPTIY